jgi:O-antigen ligase
MQMKVGNRSVRGDSGIDAPVSGLIVAIFYAYLVIEFVRPQALIPALGVIRPALILGIFLVAFSLFRVSSPIYGDKSIRLLLFLTGLCAASVTYATNTYWAYQYTVTLCLYVLAAIVPMCLILSSESRIHRFILFWIFSHTYLAFYCLTHGGRGPGSFISDENDVALALNTAIPLAYFLAQSKSVSGLIRVILALSVLVMVIGVVVTASRGGFVGLVIAGAAVIFFSEKRARNLVLVGIASVVFWFLIPADYKAEVQSISNTEDNTRLDRIYSWERGWEMFLDNPILGVGAGNYPWRVHEYELKSGSNFGQRRMLGGRAAHSLYFTLLPELGLAGSIAVLLLLARFFKSARVTLGLMAESGRKETEELRAVLRGVVVGMIGFLVTGIFISVLYYPQMWYLIAMGLVLSRFSMNNSGDCGGSRPASSAELSLAGKS